VTAARLRLAGAAVAAVALAGCAILRGERDVGAALAARRLMVPVAGVRPSDVPDTFDAPRDGGTRRHGALDIPAPRGTPVVAADEGVVLAVRQNRLGGRVVYATDPDRRFVYYYAHLDRQRDGLRPGTRLARGDVIGAVGSTGNADRREPHLHFQVMVFPGDGAWWEGRPVDPRPYLAVPGVAR